jgi:hypothetical protein
VSDEPQPIVWPDDDGFNDAVEWARDQVIRASRMPRSRVTDDAAEGDSDE